MIYHAALYAALRRKKNAPHFYRRIRMYDGSSSTRDSWLNRKHESREISILYTRSSYSSKDRRYVESRRSLNLLSNRDRSNDEWHFTFFFFSNESIKVWFTYNFRINLPETEWTLKTLKSERKRGRSFSLANRHAEKNVEFRSGTETATRFATANSI